LGMKILAILLLTPVGRRAHAIPMHSATTTVCLQPSHASHSSDLGQIRRQKGTSPRIRGHPTPRKRSFKAVPRSSSAHGTVTQSIWNSRDFVDMKGGSSKLNRFEESPCGCPAADWTPPRGSILVRPRFGFGCASRRGGESNDDYGMRRRLRGSELPFQRPVMIFPSLERTPVNRPSA
jgi:hypothetical protein